MDERRRRAEANITSRLQGLADELGIKFKVKYSFKDGTGSDVLVRIKRGENTTTEELTKFNDLAFKVVVPIYSRAVRYSYPTKI